MQWRRHLWHLIIIVITITTAAIGYSALIICQSLFQGPPASQQEKIGQKLGFPITTIFIINSKVSEGRREKPDNFIFYLPQIQRIMMVQCSLFNSGIDYSNEITSHRIRTDADAFKKKKMNRENRKMIAWYNVFVPVRLQYEWKHIQNLLFSAFVMMEAWVLELLNCKIEGLGNWWFVPGWCRG